MISPALCLLALILICLSPDGLPVSGSSWDWLGGIGLASLAFLLALSWEAESPAPQPRLTVHRNLAVAATVLALLHAIGYLITDPITFEYLKPKAPAHMLLGIAGFMIMLFVTITSLPGPRRRVYNRFSNFRRWHLGLSIAALLSAAWHVVGTEYLITGPWRLTAVLLLALLLPTFAYLARRKGIGTAIGQTAESASFANRSVTLGVLVCMLMATVYTAAKNH
jgi:DMSO/TMAO reductase YedYZ heme-binding membrane subunit